MILEYLANNELLKYPFVDSTTMLSTNTVTLANDTFLDCLIGAFDISTSFNAELTRLRISGATTYLTIRYYTLTGTTIYTKVFTFNNVDIVEKEAVSATTDEAWINVIFGKGYATLSSTYDESFTNLVFVNNVLVQPTPVVTSITFKNNGTTFKVISYDEEDENRDAVFEAGSNIAFVINSSTANLDVSPGYGTGLYDACSEELYIGTINGVAPDNSNNFLLLTDQCYTTTPQEHGLLLENHCSPKCTKEQLDNFAHYLNRVKDGLETLAELAANTADELQTQITNYNSTIALTKHNPYIKYNYAKYKGMGSNIFYSVIVGIYNPSQEELPIDITIATTGTVKTDTIRWKVKDDTAILLATEKADTLPCLSVGKLEFVFQGEPTDTFTISGTLNSIAITPIVVTVT